MLRQAALTLRPWARSQSSQAGGTPRIMKATVDGYGEGATSLLSKETFKFIVDEPPKLGGKGMGPNPLTYFLGSLVGCTQYTMAVVGKELKVPELSRVTWSAAGEYDLRGVRGEAGTDARFQKVALAGTVDTEASQEDLDRIRGEVERRCIIAATCAASGMEMSFSLSKGSVAHDCKPACELHELEGSSGTTGVTRSNPGREADSPQFAGTTGHGKAAARGYHSSAGAATSGGDYGPVVGPDENSQTSHGPAADPQTSQEKYGGKDGEDIAREHLHAEQEPQIQKETSEQGASETAGGAYASRDSPQVQAAEVGGGKSGEQIVAEQTAGATIHPDEAGNAEEGRPMKPPGYAGDFAPWAE